MQFIFLIRVVCWAVFNNFVNSHEDYKVIMTYCCTFLLLEDEGLAVGMYSSSSGSNLEALRFGFLSGVQVDIVKLKDDLRVGRWWGWWLRSWHAMDNNKTVFNDWGFSLWTSEDNK